MISDDDHNVDMTEESQTPISLSSLAKSFTTNKFSKIQIMNQRNKDNSIYINSGIDVDEIIQPDFPSPSLSAKSYRSTTSISGRIRLNNHNYNCNRNNVKMSRMRRNHIL